MTTLNAYATLAEYKAYTTARGQTATTDTVDDGVIDQLLKYVSRYFDDQTGRFYFPYVQTRYYDVPTSEVVDDLRVLKLDADLLEVISLANGDGTAIPSTEYDLKPRNQSPYSQIRLKDTSTYLWASNGSGNVHDVIAVTGIWGYHDLYSKAWLSGSTLAEALDDNEVGLDVTSGTLFAVGNIIKVESELGYVSVVSSNTLTSTRGENGSTATTHLTALPVYIWQTMESIKTVVLETAMQAYKRRTGQSTNNSATITAAGVVLTPQDIPSMAIDFIKMHRRRT